MFESDDFDQVLSQLDIPDIPTKTSINNFSNLNVNILQNNSTEIISQGNAVLESNYNNNKTINNKGTESEVNLIQNNNNLLSPKHCKRKIINSHFDSNCKRKFPGPAGLLSGTFKEYKDENIDHIELLSQDIDFSQNPLHRELFESSLWKRLLKDVNEWKLNSVETIKTIQQFALNGNLKRRKAQTITAFVECVDRSAMDPLVTLRDLTGNIKCTLHRDAWSYFSPYIVPGHSALVLSKPTILTTGGAFKKHYLNITMSNILAIYSSVHDKDEQMPDGYQKICNEDCTIIKMEKQISDETQVYSNDYNDLDSIFSDETF
ncbi:hypothetical protein RR48_08658 [Papilio machaon]|uniref:Homologous recombination OB-fold protein OB-fold domain-containing protein n=1 Tax=Papilio machaon TaxID=76193 RepID=A0A194R8L4_PAPMA|nr:uncharacterized protein LOC106712142 [Papilio machaon]KPJ13844.1 hypothetical protein RR48_08658 [Papilio machaon]